MKYLLLLPFLLAFTANGQHVDFAGTDFSRIDSIAINYAFQGKLEPAKIAEGLTKGLNTDIDKFRVIFRWIAENIEYDIDLYLKMVSHDYNPRRFPRKAKRWREKLDRLYRGHTINKSMTVCEGYSWLLESMCRSVGISCVTVTGYARTDESIIGRKEGPNHAWNAVRINDKWYLTDPTWAAGSVDLEVNRYFRDFKEVYFLADPDQLIANHFPSDPQWMFVINKPSLTEFINAPIKTTAFIENRVRHYAPYQGKVIIKKDSLCRFEFSMNKELKSVLIEKSTLRRKQRVSKTFSMEPLRTKEDYYVVSHSFTEKGSYDVGIYINRKLTFLYKVLVN